MRFPAKLLKTVSHLYLYTDGHAVMIHKKRDKDAGQVEWATAHESIGPKVQSSYVADGESGGRLIIDRCAIPLILGAEAIDWRANSKGSEASRAKNVPISCVSLKFPGFDWTFIYLAQSLISGDIRVQADAHAETWEGVKDRHRWGDAVISAHYPNPPVPHQRVA